MGSSYTSVHVRATDQNAVKKAFVDLGILPAYISKAANGWVSAYPHQTESQDDKILQKVCADLSGRLNTCALGVLVHDGDILIYSLAEKGSTTDTYNSWPGYFDGDGDAPTGGIAERLMPYCIAGTNIEEVDSILKSGGKGLPGGMGDMAAGFSIGAIKKQAVKASPWWAKPAVWGAMSLMEMASKKKQAEDAASSSANNATIGATATAAVPTLNPELMDNVWRGDRLAQALAKVLGIEHDRMASSYSHIAEDDAPIGRRALAHVGTAPIEEEYVPSPEEQASLDARMKERVAPVSERPSYQDFLAVLKNLLSAPAEEEGFKRVCVSSGTQFKKDSINMLGLAAAPVWWTFTYTADQMQTNKFCITALPREGKVQCASVELCKIIPVDDQSKEKEKFDFEFDFARSGGLAALGQPAMDGSDGTGSRYCAWQGPGSWLFLFQSPSDEMEPYKTIEYWWEPWSEPGPPSFSGNLSQWLHARHPDLF